MSDNPPPGPDPEPNRRPARMPREDRVALWLILAAICLIGLGLIWGLSALLGLLGVVIGATESGVGLRDAFLVSVPIAFGVILLFTLVAGDGLIGELGVMITGFFVMLLFFTGAILILL